MASSRWDPLRDLLTLQEHLGQLVGTDAPGWTPPVDLYETAAAFVLMAEVPGLSRDHVDIQVEEGRVTIRGERRNAPVPCEQFHRVERGHGRFARSFILPEPVDMEGVTAELTDGVLTVTLPKAGGRGARRINVS